MAEAASLLEAAKCASQDHPYLARKGIKALGLKQDGCGNLLVPLYWDHRLKPGVPNKATATIKTAAQAHGLAALDKLVALMNGCNDEIAFRAAIAILDRGYGKLAQTIAGDPEKPLEHNVTVLDNYTRRINECSRMVAAK